MKVRLDMVAARPRRDEVFRWRTAGLTNRAIAARLGLSTTRAQQLYCGACRDRGLPTPTQAAIARHLAARASVRAPAPDSQSSPAKSKPTCCPLHPPWA